MISAYEDALLAARLCAADPMLRGMVLRGGGELRDRVVAELRTYMGDVSVRRVPVSIDDERLLGGLDLGATLSSGKRVASRGLLAEADGGVIVLPMAERVRDVVASRIAAALDTGEVMAERDGLSCRSPARFVVVALDDGTDEERLPDALLDRLAFWCDLSTVRPEPLGAPPFSGGAEQEQRFEQPSAEEDCGALEVLVAIAAALGVHSIRALHFTLRAARLLAGKEPIDEGALTTAIRLVLAPRATQLPEPPEADAPDDQPQDTPPGESDPKPLEDVVLAAVLASLPPDVLAKLAAGGTRQRSAARAHGGGERRKSNQRGRPAGVRAGIPRGGLRLALIDTLRAAAPWQQLRGAGDGRVRIRKDDLRVKRYETRAEALTIFAVDASGSSAAARLAEAKGAVELLLAQAYVRRAQVALVAFRGVAAELLLPPTRSLARARRSLADLPGGGGTPMAAGLNAARELAQAAKARGRTPFVVVLTDGRANVALDGGTQRDAAERDAQTAARALGDAGVASAFVDISPRPRAEGARLASAMRARYLPLPRADARTMHAAIDAVTR